jgi:tRNA threonylcarbamoyladenosine biosynthesis protein TsaB
MANGLRNTQDVPPSAFLIPMIDARRMEVYTGIYKSDLSIVEDISAKIVDQSSFDQFDQNELILFGDGSEKFKELFSEKANISFLSFENSAAHLATLAHTKLLNGEIENMAYFEPFYLKDFVTTSKPEV